MPENSFCGINPSLLKQQKRFAIKVSLPEKELLRALSPDGKIFRLGHLSGGSDRKLAKDGTNSIPMLGNSILNIWIRRRIYHIVIDLALHPFPRPFVFFATSMYSSPVPPRSWIAATKKPLRSLRSFAVEKFPLPIGVHSHPFAIKTSL